MRRPFFLSVCLLALLLATTGVFAKGSMEPLQPLVTPGEVVLAYNQTATMTTVQSVHSLAGTLAVRNLPQIGAQRLRVARGTDLKLLCARLKKLPGVKYAEPNYRRHVLIGAPNDPAYNNVDTTVATALDMFGEGGNTWFQWGLHQIQALPAWGVWPGVYYTAADKPAGAVKVAVIDTGIDVGGDDGIPHPEFINAGGASPDAASGGQVDIADGVNVLPDYADPTYINDDYGHGTATSGIIAASTNNGSTPQSPNVVEGVTSPSPDGAAGLAYNAQIMPVKAMDMNGYGTDADIAAGILWAVDHGAVVINISAGDYEYSQAEQDAVDYAWSHGTLIVCAAGNDGPSPNRVMWPAACTGVLAVSATGVDPLNPFDDPVASYSNTGYYVNVAAPGGDVGAMTSLSVTFFGIWSCMPTDGMLAHLGGWPTWNGYGTAPQYQYQVGTSLACPYVAGLAALYAGKNSITQATPNGVYRMWKAIQQGCDDPLGIGGWGPNYGWGRINAYETLMDNNNRAAGTGCMTGQVYYRGTVIGNAWIKATPVAGGNSRGTGSKIADGGWRLSALAPGLYNVTATVFGESRTLTNVLVEAGVDTPRVYFYVGGVGSPLKVYRAAYVDATHVDVFFNQTVDTATAQNPANYAITPTLGVTAAVQQADPSVIRLTVDPQTANTPYALTVINVQALTGDPVLAPDNTVSYITPGAPILAYLGTATGYESDGVDPDQATIGTTFNMKVFVTQPDGTQPRVKVHVWDPGGVELGSSPFDMTAAASPNWQAGVVYSKPLGLSTPGTYSYAFEASNTAGTSRLPAAGSTPGPIVNRPPVLAYTGETNYTAGGCYPLSGLSGATFTFRIKYTDAEGNAPAWVKLRLWNGNVPWPGGDITMLNATGDTSWSTGVIFTLPLPIDTRGQYYYVFLANDGYATTQLPTGATRLVGPRVNTDPVLSWAGITGYTTGGVSPTTGPAGSFFNFAVKYRDPDGDPPAAIKLYLYDAAGASIPGSPFAMSLMSGLDYKTGVIFGRMVLLDAAGSYKYRFTANDGFIVVQYPGAKASGPTVTP